MPKISRCGFILLACLLPAGALAQERLSKEEATKLIEEIGRLSTESSARNLKEMTDYGFRREVSELEHKKGKLVPKSKALYLMTFSREYGQFQSALLERDGVPASEKEKRRHAEEEEEELARRKAAREKREKGEKEGGKRSVSLDKEDLSAYLIFERAGEADYEGQPAEIIRFRPDPGAPVGEEDERIEKLFRYSEGEVWLAKGTGRVLKLSYRLTDKVKPVAFIKLKSLSFELEMGLVDGKYWLPRRIEQHVEGRVAVVPIDEHTVTRQFDFQRFQVESGIEYIE